MRVGKNEASGPEKQVANFICAAFILRMMVKILGTL